MEAAGIEREYPSPQTAAEKGFAESPGELSALCLHSAGTDCQSLSPIDDDLRLIIDLWQGLPAAVKYAIRAACLASSEADISEKG